MSKRGRQGFSRGYKKRKLEDEEILSSDSEHEVPIEQKDDFFESETTETPQEKKLRLAKELIAQAEATVQGTTEELSEAAVNDRLRQLAQEREGKLLFSVAEQLLNHPSFPVTFLKGHIASPTSLAVSPSGKTCVTGAKDCCLIQWDIVGKTKLRVLKGTKHDRKSSGHSDEVLCACYSDDGKYIVTSGKDRLVKVWNEAMELLHTFKGHRDSVTGVAVQKGNSTLFSVGMDRTVNVWNLSEMLLMNTLYGHQRGIVGVDSFHSEKLVTCSEDGSVRVWKALEDSQFVYSEVSGAIDCVVVLSEDYFVSGHQDGSLCVWKVNKKKPVFSIQQAHDGEWINSLAVLPRTNLVASGSSNGVINLYAFAADRLELVNAVPLHGYINALRFTQDGKFLLAAIGQDHRLGRWTPSRKAKNGLAVIEVNVSMQPAP